MPKNIICEHCKEPVVQEIQQPVLIVTLCGHLFHRHCHNTRCKEAQKNCPALNCGIPLYDGKYVTISLNLRTDESELQDEMKRLKEKIEEFRRVTLTQNSLIDLQRKHIEKADAQIDACRQENNEIKLRMEQINKDLEGANLDIKVMQDFQKAQKENRERRQKERAATSQPENSSNEQPSSSWNFTAPPGLASCMRRDPRLQLPKFNNIREQLDKITSKNVLPEDSSANNNVIKLVSETQAVMREELRANKGSLEEIMKDLRENVGVNSECEQRDTSQPEQNVGNLNHVVFENIVSEFQFDTSVSGSTGSDVRLDSVSTDEEVNTAVHSAETPRMPPILNNRTGRSGIEEAPRLDETRPQPPTSDSFVRDRMDAGKPCSNLEYSKARSGQPTASIDVNEVVDNSDENTSSPHPPIHLRKLPYQRSTSTFIRRWGGFSPRYTKECASYARIFGENPSKLKPFTPIMHYPRGYVAAGHFNWQEQLKVVFFLKDWLLMGDGYVYALATLLAGDEPYAPDVSRDFYTHNVSVRILRENIFRYDSLPPKIILSIGNTDAWRKKSALTFSRQFFGLLQVLKDRGVKEILAFPLMTYSGQPEERYKINGILQEDWGTEVGLEYTNLQDLVVNILYDQEPMTIRDSPVYKAKQIFPLLKELRHAYDSSWFMEC